MDDLIAFLRARLDEDADLALAASPGPWHPDEEHDEVVAVDGVTVAEGFALSGRQLRATVDHIARHHPARVLAEVDAKRRILCIHNIPTVVSPKTAALGLREGEAPEDDRRCVGCGLDAMDEPITADVNECPILRALALPYADYRDTWRP